MKKVCLLLALLAFSLLTSGVMGDSATASISPAADRASKFYLQSNDPFLNTNQSYQAEVKVIEHLGETKDLKGLANLADDIEKTWGHQSDTRGYFALMDAVTSVLVSNNFGGDIASVYRQDELTQKYVHAILAHGNVPLDITARALPRLISQERITFYKRPFNEANWAQLRRTRTSLWLQTRQRLKQSIIPNYDFTTPLPTNNTFDLDKMKDPKWNAARTKELQESIRKGQGRNDQSFVRFLDKIFSPQAENEMMAYYSHVPYDTPELKRFLDTYIDDTATRQKILDQVAKNISAAPPK